MAIGVNVQRNYVSSGLNSAGLQNNWSVLVFGVTNQGPSDELTSIRTYQQFLNIFGQPISSVPTHNYVNFLVSNNVNVLFKRIVDLTDVVTSSVTISHDSKDLFKILANDNYNGEVGNKLSVKFSVNDVTNVGIVSVNFDGKEVESFNLGVITDAIPYGQLLFNAVHGTGTDLTNDYVVFQSIDENEDDWKALDNTWTTNNEQVLAGGSSPKNDLETAIDILSDYTHDFWQKNRKIKDAAAYYPQLRFVTTGGIVADDVNKQNVINHNLGQFVSDCKQSFRALIDYSITTIDKDVVKKFARSEITAKNVTLDNYAYFGYWGTDSNGNWLPGSAGFLSALGLNNYNVYSRRIAGTGFTPAFTKTYENVYFDELNDWQNPEDIQLNPIMIINAQDNLAVMGSSTLALPAVSPNFRNPAQALDIVLVGDYVSAIMKNIAVELLEGSIDRLSLNNLSNTLSKSISDFVNSNAITRYDLRFDATEIGKLNILCDLYFAVGLEEVSITVTSLYDIAESMIVE